MSSLSKIINVDFNVFDLDPLKRIIVYLFALLYIQIFFIDVKKINLIYICIVKSPKQSLGDLLFLLRFLLLSLPNKVWGTYCFCSVSYY